MTHEIKIYIKQPDTLSSTTYVKKYYGTHSYLVFGLDSIPVDVVKRNKITVVNSMNPWLDALWEQENLDRSMLTAWRQTNKKLIVMEWDLLKPIADIIDSDIDLPDDQDNNIYTDYLHFDNTDNDLFVAVSKDTRIIDFISNKYTIADDEIPLDENTVVIRKLWPIFNFQDNLVYGYVGDTNIHKYRIYLGDRMLTERFYPVESGGNFQVVESISLNSGSDGTLRIISPYGLVIDKIEIDGQTVMVNDITYDLLLS